MGTGATQHPAHTDTPMDTPPRYRQLAQHYLDAIRAGWEAEGKTPKTYNAGSWGPSAAIALADCRLMRMASVLAVCSV